MIAGFLLIFKSNHNIILLKTLDLDIDQNIEYSIDWCIDYNNFWLHSACSLSFVGKTGCKMYLFAPKYVIFYTFVTKGQALDYETRSSQSLLLRIPSVENVKMLQL